PRASRASPLPLHHPPPHQQLHSFPTRRSSDLAEEIMPRLTWLSIRQKLVEVSAHLTENLFPGRRDTQAALHALSGFLGKIVRRVDRKSTRLNSSHLGISYAVFCLKKKKEQHHH